MRPAKPFTSFLAIFVATAAIISAPTEVRGVTHQVDYNDERGEYCYRESVNIGLCLGRHREQELADGRGGNGEDGDARIVKCLECSGSFQGDETCDELKAYNNLASSPPDDNPATTAAAGGAGGAQSDDIQWGDSFCEQYEVCVEENCPKECMREQDAWIECLILELDCDWRCEPGSSFAGDRTMGLSMAAAGGSKSRASRWDSVLRLGLLVGGGIFLGS